MLTKQLSFRITPEDVADFERIKSVRRFITPRTFFLEAVAAEIERLNKAPPKTSVPTPKPSKHANRALPDDVAEEYRDGYFNVLDTVGLEAATASCGNTKKRPEPASPVVPSWVLDKYRDRYLEDLRCGDLEPDLRARYS